MPSSHRFSLIMLVFSAAVFVLAPMGVGQAPPQADAEVGAAPGEVPKKTTSRNISDIPLTPPGNCSIGLAAERAAEESHIVDRAGRRVKTITPCHTPAQAVVDPETRSEKDQPTDEKDTSTGD